MTIGLEIKRRRKSLKWTLEELSNRVGTDTGNLSRLENGKQGYSDETLNRIAEALGCSIADLFTPNTSSSISNLVVPIGSKRVPLISYVQAGAMSEVHNNFQENDGENYLLTDLDLSTNAFALQIKGDSMLPEFKEGDRIIIDPEVLPQPGDYVVAKNGKEEATFKKFRPRGINEDGKEVFELVPLNDDYATMRSDTTALLIIGTMIEHRRYRKK